MKGCHSEVEARKESNCATCSALKNRVALAMEENILFDLEADDEVKLFEQMRHGENTSWASLRAATEG